MLFFYLPPGKHHIHGHSFVRACKLVRKQGAQKHAVQPKQSKTKQTNNMFFLLSNQSYRVQVLISPQQPHKPVAHSFRNAHGLSLGCTRTVRNVFM